MLITTKQCSKCEKIKNLLEFHKDKKTKDGYYPSCKNCKKEYNKKNKNNMQKRQKTYREENKQKIKEARKKYKTANKEEINKKAREQYLLNKEAQAERKKIYYEKNKQKINDRNNRYYEENKDTTKDRQKRYSKTEQGKMVRVNSDHKRRSRKKQTTDGTIPLDLTYPLTKELTLLIEKQDYKCNSCGGDITENKHLDHHIPLSKGGLHSINNVVWLCPSCNLAKGNSLPTELLLL